MASILFNQSEVGGIISGRGMVLRDDVPGADGQYGEYYVRMADAEDNEFIDARNLPTVLVDRAQLREVAFGWSVTAYVSDDSAACVETVTLRLATLEEFRQGQSQAAQWFHDRGLWLPPELPDSQIVPLLTPLPGLFNPLSG